jgi:hypothetical protein
VRRLVSLVFAGALISIMAAGTVSAAPNRSATLWACTTATGVTLHVDWAGYHPDTLTTDEWATGASTTTTFSTARSVDWKFGTSSYDESFADWAADGVTVAADSNFAVQLWAHNRLAATTNSVLFGDLAGC